MPTSYLTADRTRSSPCPKCHTPTMLTGIKPSQLGFDLRAFRCEKCNCAENSGGGRKKMAFQRIAAPHRKSLSLAASSIIGRMHSAKEQAR